MASHLAPQLGGLRSIHPADFPKVPRDQRSGRPRESCFNNLVLSSCRLPSLYHFPPHPWESCILHPIPFQLLLLGEPKWRAVMANVSICGRTGCFKGIATRHQEPVGALGPRCGERHHGVEMSALRVGLFCSAVLPRISSVCDRSPENKGLLHQPFIRCNTTVSRGTCSSSPPSLPKAGTCVLTRVLSHFHLHSLSRRFGLNLNH